MQKFDSDISKATFVLHMKVRDYEIDSEGIVNNAIYLHYFEHTRHEFCDSVGYSFRRMLDEQIVPVVREISVRYLEPLRLGDEFDSCLKLERRGPRFIFRQWILHGGSGNVAAEGEITIVALEDGRLGRGDRLGEIFTGYIS